MSKNSQCGECGLIEPSNQLTPAQAERLHKLVEEAGEIVQAAAKVLRHGYKSYDPTLPVAKRSNNESDLEKEIADLNNAVKRLHLHGDVSMGCIQIEQEERFDAAAKYMHHQEDPT